MSAQVARVKAKARPWRSIIALILALCGLAAGEVGRYSHLDPTGVILKYAGAAVFLVFGLAASFGLSGQSRDLLRPVIGAAHAGVGRYAIVLVGIFAVLVITLNIANVPVGQLVLGGAVTGVLLGIAAQQSLSNLFAGMVLLFARPFRVGDRVRFRAGAIGGGGLLDGTVVDISIAYVRLETAEGLVYVPNSQALAASVGPLPPPPEPGPEPPAAAQRAPRDAGNSRDAGPPRSAAADHSAISSAGTAVSNGAATSDGPDSPDRGSLPG